VHIHLRQLGVIIEWTCKPAATTENAMFKLLFVLPVLLAGFVALCVGGLVLLPLLALLPVLLAVCAGVFAVVLVVRIMAAIIMGIGGVMVGVIGFAFMLAAGAVVLALGVALMHLLLPLLFVAGLIWLIRRSAKAAPAPLLIGHG
jgi:hypothetical protein